MKKLILLLLLMSIGCIINAQINSIASGNWNNPGVWQGGQVPGATDDVVINGHSITLNVVAEVNNLTFNNATFNGNSNMNINGNFTWNGGTIGGNGQITVVGNMLANTASTKNISNKTLLLQGSGSVWTAGTIDNSNSGNITIDVNGEFTTSSAVTLTMQNGSGGTGNFIINGVIKKLGTGNLSIGNSIQFNNNGAIEIEAGNITCSNSTSNHTGHFNIITGSRLRMTTGLHNFNGATSEGEGFLSVEGGTMTNGNQLSVLARFLVNSGTVNTGNPLEVNNAFHWEGGTLTGAGLITVSGNASLNNTTKNINTKTLLLQGLSSWTAGTIDNSNSGNITIDVNGEFTASSAVTLTMQNGSGGTGNFIINGVIKKLGTGNLSIGNSIQFNNNGTSEIENGNITCSNSTSNHTGHFNITTGSRFRMTSGSHNFNGATSEGDGFLGVEGGTMTNGNQLSVLARLLVFSGSVNTGHQLEISNYFIWEGGTLSGAGLITVSGNAALYNGATKNINTKTLLLQGISSWTAGTIDNGNSGSITIDVNGEFTASSAGTLTMQNGAGGAGNFINNGEVKKLGAGNLSIGNSIQFNNNGTLEIENGNITCSNSNSNHTGHFNITIGSRLRMTSGSHNFNGATSEGEGFLSVEGGTMTNGNQLSVLARLLVSSGTVNTTHPMEISNAFNWEGGILTGVGLITVSGNAALYNTTKNINTKTLLLQGISSWTAGTIDNGNFASITIDTNGEFTASSSSTLTMQNGSGGVGNFVNNGVMRKLSNGDVNINSPIQFNNNGILEIENGNITCSNSTSNHTGHFNITTGSRLRMTSGSHNFNGATSEGEGFLSVEGGTMTNGAQLSVLARILVNSGIVNTGHPLEVSNAFHWEGGNLTGAGLITVSGNAALYNTTKNINTKTLLLQGISSWTAGTIDNGINASITIDTNGEFTASSASTLTMQNGSGGTGNFVNNGVVVKSGAGQWTTSNQITFQNNGILTGVGIYSIPSTTFNQNGIIAPGLSAGQLTIDRSSVAFTSNASLNIELLDDSGPGTGHDRAIFTGTVALNGSLTVTELESMPNGSYTILTCNGGANCRTGTFSFTDLPDCFSVQYTGNSVILVKDDQSPPEIVGCPNDVTINTDPGQCYAVYNITDPQASDDCLLASFEGNMPPLNQFPVGLTIVTFIATDGSGNSSSCTFEVTVEDVQSPTITGCPNNMIVQTTTSCTAIVSWTEPQATDNCELSAFEGDTTNGEEYGLGTFTVHYIATDLYNNTSTCTFTVSVVDQSNPIITNCPTNIAMSADEGTCTATVSWEEPSAMDNCGIQSFVGDGDNGGSYATTVTTVTYTAIDVNSNQSTCTFTITVTDNEEPVINNCPEDINVNTNAGTCVATVSWTAPTATDNCGEPTLESSHSNGGTYELGSTLITYTATDGGGLMSTCSFNISVTDIESPNITDCPEDIEINTNEGLCVAIVSWNEPNANDNCSVQSFVGDGDNGGNYGVGTSTVTYTATDGSNNQTNCSFSIIVFDNQAPEILGCPDDIEMTTMAGQCFATVNWTEPSAIDNCGEPELVGDGTNGGNYPVGLSMVTYLATDLNGQSSTCTFNINIMDNELPIITNCPTNIEVPTDFGQCTAIVSWTEPEATDNCGVESFISSQTNGGAYPIGVTQVNYIATDAQSNTAQCGFTISVLDEFIITCPEDVTVCIDGNEILLTGAEPSGGVFSGNGVIDGIFYPSVAGVGLHVILYELQIGECISNCTFFIVVTPLPVVLCPDNFEVCIVDQPFELIQANPQGGLYTGPGVVANVFDPASAGIGTHEINYSFTDTNDCESNCDFSINVYTQTLWYADTDGDGFGDPDDSLLACEQPEGYVSNNLDNCPLDFNKIDEGQCGCGIVDIDTDGDGTADCNDECPLDPDKINPGQCGCGIADIDSDGDGTADCNDECPLDPDKVNPGICGCGISDIDTDGDGTADCNDECPLDPDKINPGQCGCGIADTDTDGDGVADCNDECPLDPDKINPGQCGCGIADIDTDGDGVADCNDECPLDPNLTIAPTWYADVDGDGFGDASNFMVSCLQPEGYVSNNLDCNDSDAEINPNAIETCNGYDDNCDGIIDEGCSVLGCLDPEAHNYNPEATDDDGSCETCADQIKNGDETGVDCGGILCPICPGDDFFVTYPTLSKEIVEPGETLLASVLHHYSGAEPSVFAYVGFYLSEDDQLDQTDILLNDEVSTLGYYNGFDYESGNIEIPVNTVEGNYYILFVADYNQLYSEIDENNNLLALPITVETLPVGDDFFITEAAVSATTVSPGGTLSASCLQNYSGSSETTLNVAMGYYYSTDAIWDASDVLLNTDESTLSASDTSDEEDATITIPISAVAGTAYILYVADHTDAFEETDEDNNVSAVAITIDAPPVGNDFFIANATTNHAQRNPGQSLSMSCHQSYAGSSFSTLIVRMGYYLSTDDQFDAGDVRLGTDNSGLSATKTSEYEDLTRNIPFGTAHGYYYILFVADDNGIYAETNENNNTVAIPITIGNPPLLREVNHAQNIMSTNYILTNDSENIKEHKAYAEIQVSPNPFSQFIHLDWISFGDLESVNCVIRDHTGRMVSNFKNVIPGAYLETNNLISGMYVLEIFSTSDTLVNRYRVIKVE